MQPNPFDLQEHTAYRLWRDRKLAGAPRRWQDLVVDIADPRRLGDGERRALLRRCATANMAIYRSTSVEPDKGIVSAVASQLGLCRLDGNWLADEDGISPIEVAVDSAERRAFIPYTDRPIQWHTDGYYQPPSRPVRAMLLHCVRSAASGGENLLMDPEMAYIAMRDTHPDGLLALMAPDAMTIPERRDDDGVARAEQSGAVFSVHAQDGCLHMRYTARTRSVVWKDDPATRAGEAFLRQLLQPDAPHVFQVRLEPGMGLVCNNVLHQRAGFVDDPLRPRLLYRARYLDRVAPLADGPTRAVAQPGPPAATGCHASAGVVRA